VQMAVAACTNPVTASMTKSAQHGASRLTVDPYESSCMSGSRLWIVVVVVCRAGGGDMTHMQQKIFFCAREAVYGPRPFPPVRRKVGLLGSRS
jgi:hypothetical protein